MCHPEERQRKKETQIRVLLSTCVSLLSEESRPNLLTSIWNPFSQGVQLLLQCHCPLLSTSYPVVQQYGYKPFTSIPTSTAGLFCQHSSLYLQKALEDKHKSFINIIWGQKTTVLWPNPFFCKRNFIGTSQVHSIPHNHYDECYRGKGQ